MWYYLLKEAECQIITVPSKNNKYQYLHAAHKIICSGLSSELPQRGNSDDRPLHMIRSD